MQRLTPLDQSAETVRKRTVGMNRPLPMCHDRKIAAIPTPTPARKRRVSQLFGTLLIVAGLLTIALTVGITAWHRHQQDADTRAFLARVSTPTTLATPAAGGARYIRRVLGNDAISFNGVRRTRA